MSINMHIFNAFGMFLRHGMRMVNALVASVHAASARLSVRQSG
jgi:hypothetical protein